MPNYGDATWENIGNFFRQTLKSYETSRFQANPSGRGTHGPRAEGESEGPRISLHRE